MIGTPRTTRRVGSRLDAVARAAELRVGVRPDAASRFRGDVVDSEFELTWRDQEVHPQDADAGSTMSGFHDKAWKSTAPLSAQLG